MIVFCGYGGGNYCNTGGFPTRPSSDRATSTTSAPSGRYGHTAVWTGTEMIVWGGIDGSQVVGSGGRYNPTSNTWQATSRTGAAPQARYGHAAVWTGTEMIVWSGSDLTNDFISGGR